MATSVLRLGQLCSAAAATSDGTLVAVATPSHSVMLLRRSGSSWQRLEEGQTLPESHEGTITSLAFTAAGGSGGGSDEASSAAAPPLRLVSSSHDRGSYVFTRQQDQQQQQAAGGAGHWKAELVITKLAKAGLCCAWAPGGLKFAIGSSDRLVDVVYLDAARELWAPRMIKKRHGSAVMALTWHPSGGALATAAADGCMRLLSAVVPEVDGQPSLAALAASRLGDCLLDLALPGAWGLAAAFSPTGAFLAVASQGAEGSYLTLLSGLDLNDPSSLDAAAIEAAAAGAVEAKAAAGAAAAAGEAAGAAGAAGAPRMQHLRLPGLPLKCLAFLSETLLVGGGFDCQPQLFSLRGDGAWQHACSLRGIKPSSQSDGANKQPPSSSLSARIKLFEQQAAAATATSKGGSSSSRGAAAAAAPVAGAGQGGSTSGSGGSGSGAQGPHETCIISVRPVPSRPASSSSNGSSSSKLGFVTVSMEGCIAEWHVDPASLC